MQWLRQGTVAVVNFGPATDKTDGVTLEPGLVSALDHVTTGILLSKNGGAKAVRNGTPTASVYDSGDYRVTVNATDTDTLGHLRLSYYDAATLVPMWADFMVIPAIVYDALVLGTDALEVDTATIVAAVLTTQVTESYRAKGDAPTVAQALCEILAHEGENAFVGTIKTIRKFDGSTTAETFTMDSATLPTTITRTT